jgi:hypothetical protein
MGRVKALIFAALAVALSSGTASADNVEPCLPFLDCPVTLTLYGTVTSGTDNFGFFGTQGADLTGQSATLAFSTYRGGIGSFIVDLEGTTTIAGHSWGFPSEDGGWLNLYGNSVDAHSLIIGYACCDDVPYTYWELDASVSSGVNSFVPPQDLITNWGQADYLTHSFSYDLQPGDSGTAEAFGLSFLPDVCSGEPSCTTEEDIGVSIYRVTLDAGPAVVPAAVPEPATGMMVLIALSGIMLVRRQQERAFPFRSH